jgi:phosphocarrier protein HPr
MIERTATIASTVGLHARPATALAQAAAEYRNLEITVAAEGDPLDEAVDVTSVLSLMSLGAQHGDKMVLRADGDGAEDALDRLVQLLETNYDAHQ